MSQAQEDRQKEPAKSQAQRAETELQDLPEFFRLLESDLSVEERARLSEDLGRAEPSLKREFELSQGLARALSALSPASRRLCPSPEERFQGAQNQLARALQARFDRHLDRCRFCKEDVADARALLQPNLLQVLVKFGKSALEVISSELESSFSLSPALVVRASSSSGSTGSTTVWRGSIEKGDGILELELSGDETKRALLSLVSRRGDRAIPVSALLFQGQQVLEGKTAADGRLSFDSLQAGDYELRVREKSRENTSLPLEWQLGIRVESEI